MKSILDMYLNESFILNDEDIYINFDKWKKNTENNVLFITGLSGSGKSTLAEQLSDSKNAIMFEIDGIEYNYDSSNKGILNKILKKFPEYKDRTNNYKLYQKILDEVLSYMYNDKNHLYIVEGIQIFQWFKPEDFISEPIIIKNTSFCNSLINRFRRNGHGKVELRKELQNEFLNLLDLYMEHNKMINRFKRDLKKGVKYDRRK